MSAIGRIYPRGSNIALTFCQHVVIEDVVRYTLFTAQGGLPVIQSRRTGKYFILPWQDILDLALKSGIDKHE